MKILVDTNVLLDIVLQREPFRQSSHQVVALCQQEELEGAIAANTIADMFYILRKDFSVQERKTNTRHFQNSTIPALSPQEFCQRLTLSK